MVADAENILRGCCTAWETRMFKGCNRKGKAYLLGSKQKWTQEKADKATINHKIFESSFHVK